MSFILPVFVGLGLVVVPPAVGCGGLKVVAGGTQVSPPRIRLMVFRRGYFPSPQLPKQNVIYLQIKLNLERTLPNNKAVYTTASVTYQWAGAVAQI